MTEKQRERIQNKSSAWLNGLDHWLRLETIVGSSPAVIFTDYRPGTKRTVFVVRKKKKHYPTIYMVK